MKEIKILLSNYITITNNLIESTGKNPIFAKNLIKLMKKHISHYYTESDISVEIKNLGSEAYRISPKSNQQLRKEVIHIISATNKELLNKEFAIDKFYRKFFYTSMSIHKDTRKSLNILKLQYNVTSIDKLLKLLIKEKMEEIQ